MMYGLEFWAVNKMIEYRMCVSEISILRLMSGIIGKYKITNTITIQAVV